MSVVELPQTITLYDPQGVLGEKLIRDRREYLFLCVDIDDAYCSIVVTLMRIEPGKYRALTDEEYGTLCVERWFQEAQLRRATDNSFSYRAATSLDIPKVFAVLEGRG